MAKRNLETASGEISSDSLCTPPEISLRLYELWGRDPIGCDPCSNEHSIVRAKVSYPWGGLVKPWADHCYENHPYSKNEPWIDKATAEMKAGRVHELVILCMTATSTAWWKTAMNKPRRNPRVICTKRIKFLGPGGKPLPHGARFDTSLIYYGRHTAKFDRLFARVAMWTTWGR
jgi:hypothetical protein